MMQPNHASVPAIVFRCLTWMMTIGLIVAGVAPRSTLASQTLLVLGATTAIYTIAWCIFLPRLARWATRYPILLLLDIALSSIPAAISGGWLSPFAPFILGAMMLPGALFHWRGVAGALVGYVVVDQLVGWATWPAAWDSMAVLPYITLGYIRPLVAATIWPLSFELWKWRTRQHARHEIPSDLLHHVVPPRHLQQSLTSVKRLPAREPETGVNAATAWRTTHQPAQTLEHVSVLPGPAIKQVVAEAEVRGLQVRVRLAQLEADVPQSHVQLLAKAVEIGLDNVQQHAATREAEVDLVVDQKAAQPMVVVTVRDHGRGLLDGTADMPGFHQIKRLRYRLQDIEGSLDVREADDGGVLLVVRVPITGAR